MQIICINHSIGKHESKLKEIAKKSEQYAI